MDVSFLKPAFIYFILEPRSHHHYCSGSRTIKLD